MVRLFRKCLVILFICFLAFGSLLPVRADRGVPGSPEFGIGATIFPDGPYQTQALEMLADLEPDWLAVPLSWASVQPNSTQPPRLDSLEPVMRVAAAHKVAVMISLSAAPAWAQTRQGPNPELSAGFINVLLDRYPGVIRAIELFPGANTREGWGADPDPASYASLFRVLKARLAASELEVLLVAGGLRQRAESPSPADINDLDFLSALYALDAAGMMPVISIQYGEVTGEPVAFPTRSEHSVLRHYEEVRRVMSENHHQTGLIWITRLSPPSGKIEASDDAYHDPNAQSNWMSLAYIQMRAQIYIGVTIGQSLNPGPEGAGAGVPSLINDAGMYHPFYSVLHEMISLNRDGSVTIMPGKPKEGNLAKQRSP